MPKDKLIGEREQYVIICDGPDQIVVAKIKVEYEKLFVDEMKVRDILISLSKDIGKSVMRHYLNTKDAH